MSRSVLIDAQRAVFILLTALKAEQLVTGRVHRMLTNTWIFGYIVDMRRRV